MDENELERFRKCVSAGMTIHYDEGKYGTTIFPSNAGLRMGTRATEVPFSELAIHTKIAGNQILAFNTDGRGACVVSINKDGKCSTTCGLMNEVLSHELRDHSRHIWDREYRKKMFEERGY